MKENIQIFKIIFEITRLFPLEHFANELFPFFFQIVNILLTALSGFPVLKQLTNSYKFKAVNKIV